jgi:hypothetical protein
MIDHLDHLVLTDADADAGIAFYLRVPGRTRSPSAGAGSRTGSAGGINLHTIDAGDPDMNLAEIPERPGYSNNDIRIAPPATPFGHVLILKFDI